MGQNLAGLGLTLDDFTGQRAIDALEQDDLRDALRVAGVPDSQLTWLAFPRGRPVNRVLIARDSQTGRCKGLMLIEACGTADETGLVIEAVIPASSPAAQTLLRRMISFLILRMQTMDVRPAGLMVYTRNPLLCAVLQTVGEGIPAAGFYPDPDGRVIALRTAGLAHRMAAAAGVAGRFDVTRRALTADRSATAADGPFPAVLDLRRAGESQLTEGARKLFRDRPDRARRPVPAAAVATLAPPAQPPRRQHRRA